VPTAVQLYDRRATVENPFHAGRVGQGPVMNSEDTIRDARRANLTVVSLFRCFDLLAVLVFVGRRRKGE
jgi:hypothetical protein